MRVMSEYDLDAWAKDVIKWTNEKLREGRVDEVFANLDDIITALVVSVRKEFRDIDYELIKTVVKLVGGKVGDRYVG